MRQSGFPSAERALMNAQARHGFLTKGEVHALAEDNDHRLDAVLIRCGGGRFSCPAQDAEHFIKLIEREPYGDFVRDVSIPFGGGSFDPRRPDPRPAVVVVGRDFFDGREYYPDLVNDELAHSDADPGL
jgi:hypothetical protein